MKLPVRQLCLTLLLGLGLVTTPCLSQELPAPTDLEVVRDGNLFKGRWNAVKGASYYEVWVNSFGRWSFNPKKLETSPFTSSFELPVSDERAVFKVRAMDAEGKPGKYSADVPATRFAKKDKVKTTSTTNQSKGKDASFDPKAPPPDRPTSLFAIWVEPSVIKLVWRGPKEAKSYSVEELVEGKWKSIPFIEFPKVNNALIKKHPSPGPYKFRVRSVGANGRASEPSRPTTAKR